MSVVHGDTICRQCKRLGFAADEFVSPYTGLCAECNKEKDMNEAKVRQDCTCTTAACHCGTSGERTSFVNSKSDVADLVRIIAERETWHDQFASDSATKRLREALDRLIDERVAARLAEKKEEAKPEPKRTRGQEIAEDYIALVNHTTDASIDGGRECSMVRMVGHKEPGTFLAELRASVAVLIDRAIAEEREACAVTAENIGRSAGGVYIRANDALKDTAEAIRRRK